MSVFKFFSGNAQHDLLYPVPQTVMDPRRSGFNVFQLDAPDLETGKVICMHSPSSTGKYIVFFHGNGDQIGDGPVGIARKLQPQGHGFLAVEYPGYGLAASGVPHEATLYRAAARALDHLATNLGGSAANTVLVGQSLGAAVALEMAVRGYGSGLVLISPFTSIKDMAGLYFPRFLVNAFKAVSDDYNNLAKAPYVRIPTAIVHGTYDEVTPVSMGAQLERAIHGAKLTVIPAGHHDVFSGSSGQTCLRQILSVMQGGGHAAAPYMPAASNSFYSPAQPTAFPVLQPTAYQPKPAYGGLMMGMEDAYAYPPSLVPAPQVVMG